MMTEDYVSFETAKLLKEKGFEENTPVNYFVGDDKPRGCVVGEMIYHKRIEEDTHLIACPTLQMAMKWLREVHKLFIQVCIVPHTTVTMEQKYYFFSIHKDRRNCAFRDGFPNTYYSTYEEACEAAIKYCLENLI